MWRTGPGRYAILCAAVAALTMPPVGAPARADAAAIDHMECAGNYSALSLALPYLPGIFLMFAIAWRSGHAQSHYRRTTPGAEELPRREIIDAAERRKREMLESFEAGETTLEQMVVRAHECDAFYGLNPVPVTLNDLLRQD